jgi:hypothetical protein
MVLAELHRINIAEDESAYDNLTWGALGSLGAAFFLWWIMLIILDMFICVQFLESGFEFNGSVYPS